MEDQEKPAIAPPVFLFQKDKAQKRPAEGSSAEDGEDSDRDDTSYCPPAKRERTSSFNQFPPSHSVSKNNVFMPSSLCQSPTESSSDSEPEEKTVGFRLKPPTLIHGQAPSTGVPSQKPKEQHRSVLRPAVLQPPPSKTLSHTGLNSGTNGVNCSSAPPVSHGNTDNHDGRAENTDASREDKERDESRKRGERTEREDPPLESTFVFGQNVRDRAKVEESSKPSDIKEKRRPSVESPAGETNYFLQYISTPSSQPADNDSSDTSAKFVFGQNMSDRVLSPPAEGSTESPGPLPSQPLPQEDSSEKDRVGAAASLEASAAAYTKATAKRCLLEKVEVITGEEAESNVLQIQCKLFVFDKQSQSWVERGRGLLRLNDMASMEEAWPPGSLQSRLVMRTQGSLRLILNTKLWAQMQTDKASEKSLRITAMDTEDQGLKVFLVAASSKDTGQLYAALHHRILALRSRGEQEPEPRPLPPTGHAPQSNEEDSDEDQAPNHAPPGATATGSAPSATETGSPPSSGTSEGSDHQPGCSGSGGS